MALDLDGTHLRSFAAAVGTGSLEAAAEALHVTPSAMSQRLRALENAVGQVLLVRSRPLRPTPSGEVVLRLARQVLALQDEAAAELGAGDAGTAAGSAPVVAVAVNADSLATWVLPALAPLLAGTAPDGVLLDLYRADQDRTHLLLRDGTVTGAVTSRAEPAPGCRSRPLGRMRYRAMASAAWVEQWFADAGRTALTDAAVVLTRAPMVRYDCDDDLQHVVLRRAGTTTEPPTHLVPATGEHLAAVGLGLGWGMVPDVRHGRPLGAPDGLVPLPLPGDTGTVEVALHWQSWRLRSPALERVGDALAAAADDRLFPAAGA
ncbi:ArgP/LysG family DNA-binding transcriptional regulator [Aquipuribacter sp. SD81]|uniref:ArgP/LysG family DNA-binding transcriptional regulator n=1 Tax=Aquipuribacter sp. SD81 TaxID=3127703 RepID=UPI003016AF12